jgi:hypothetical protein
LLLSALVAMLALAMVASPALAAKGGGKPGGGSTGSSLSLRILTSTDGVANYGETVTFDIVTSATRPFVSVNCYQAGTWVYSASVGYFADYPWSQTFTLASNSWPAGSGDCTARLYTSKDGIRTTTLATLPFSVQP